MEVEALLSLLATPDEGKPCRNLTIYYGDEVFLFFDQAVLFFLTGDLILVKTPQEGDFVGSLNRYSLKYKPMDEEEVANESQ